MKVEIKNFQSIKEVDLNIDRFTCLVGESDIGKSAIIRAIKGALTNPSIKSEIRKDEKELSVRLEIGNDIIEWVKGLKKTQYNLTLEGKETTLEKLQGQVPKEFEKASLSPVVLDSGESINLYTQEQFDLPFMDNEPRLLADLVSKFGSLDKINKAHILISKKIKSDKREAKTLESEIQDLEEKIEEIKDISSIRDRFSEIQKTEKKIEKGRQLLEEIKNKLKDLKDLKEQKDKLSAIIKLIDKDPYDPQVMKKVEALHSIKALIRDLSKSQKEKKVLKSIIGKIKLEDKDDETLYKTRQITSNARKAYQELNDLQKMLKTQSKFSEILVPETKDIDEILKTAKELKEKRHKIRQLTTECTGGNSDLNSEKHTLLMYENEIIEIRKKLEQVKICPTCGSEGGIRI